MHSPRQVMAATSLMRLSPADTFKAARMLISSSYVWTQNARARDSHGNKCAPNDPDASQWSINGALAVVSNPQGITPTWLLQCLDQLVVECGQAELLYSEGGVLLWSNCDDLNDDRSHADVLNLLTTAESWMRGNGY
jgi:hypothetical protein